MIMTNCLTPVYLHNSGDRADISPSDEMFIEFKSKSEYVNIHCGQYNMSDAEVHYIRPNIEIPCESLMTIKLREDDHFKDDIGSVVINCNKNVGIYTTLNFNIGSNNVLDFLSAIPHFYVAFLTDLIKEDKGDYSFTYFLASCNTFNTFSAINEKFDVSSRIDFQNAECYNCANAFTIGASLITFGALLAIDSFDSFDLF